MVKDFFENNDVVESIEDVKDGRVEGDDKIVTELLRDDELFKSILVDKIDERTEEIEDKTDHILGSIVDMTSLVEEYSLNCIRTKILGMKLDRDLTTEDYIKYKSLFCESRLKVVDMRINKVEMTDEERHQFIIESGELFDFLVNAYINEYASNVKKNLNKNEVV